jgi:DNA-directed RNA polymerase subunit RPC12/RpoP
MDKDTQVYEMWENIETQNNIRCTSCKQFSHRYDEDPYHSAKEFISGGWRITKYGNIYCPKCSKKKLKN